MNPQDARERLSLFLESLPEKVFSALLDKGVAEIHILPTTIAAEQGFVFAETGALCEGVLRVLKGEASPDTLVAFIQQDKNIEEDNVPKIPTIAYELQTKLFDPVLPILKQAGYPIKEGRVPEPIKPASSFQVSGSSQETGARFQVQGSSQNKLEANSLKLEPNHIRALIRIAAGTKYSEEELRNAFEDLPMGLRQSVSSVDTANAIQAIAKKYLLHVDQMAALASETGLVLLGLTHPADFIKNLADRLRVPEERAREIARDVSSQILVKVRESLRSMHAEVVQPPPVGVGPRLEAGTSFSIPKPSVVPKPASSFQVQGSSPETGARFQVLGSSQNKLEAKSYKQSTTIPLSASSTPYSAGAKWNMGENILKKQVGTTPGLAASPLLKGALPSSAGGLSGTPFGMGKTTPASADGGTPFGKGDRGGGEEEPLSRADVLRDIENPKGIVPVPRIAAPTLPSSSLTAKGYQSKASPIGPTGWKPSINTIGSSSSPLPKYPINKLEPAIPNIPPPEGKAISPNKGSTAVSGRRGITTPAPADGSTPFTRQPPKAAPFAKGDGDGDKTRPQSESNTPPLRQPADSPQMNGEEEEDFLDQKLQAPMSLPREEKRYSTDPYREPLQ
ncbi:MAG: hypothetical protein UY50_C0023G0022 [Parcubacteria group bacterium GW2011_GWA2_49_9]|nr:MAG: hypothetical protein UY50_C0023G0022 [Parcubacteria group bacterium GW2011_GWA2_49_9]